MSGEEGKDVMDIVVSAKDRWADLPCPLIKVGARDGFIVCCVKSKSKNIVRCAR